MQELNFVICGVRDAHPYHLTGNSVGEICHWEKTKTTITWLWNDTSPPSVLKFVTCGVREAHPCHLTGISIGEKCHQWKKKMAITWFLNDSSLPTITIYHPIPFNLEVTMCMTFWSKPVVAVKCWGVEVLYCETPPVIWGNSTIQLHCIVLCTVTTAAYIIS